jgi:outer membrane immunogenic protein
MRTIPAMALLAVAAVGLVPGTANADPPDRYVPCCGSSLDYNWSGLFVGGHLGAAVSNLDWTLQTSPFFIGVDHSATAFAGGLQIALQRQWERMLLGVEISYTWTDLEASRADTFGDARNLFIIAGKLGYAYERWLAFGKAGYASADIDLRCSFCGPGQSSSDREQGWTLGIGLDYAVTDRVILGVAYDWALFDVGRRVVGTVPVDGSADIQTFTARVMFKLGPVVP